MNLFAYGFVIHSIFFISVFDIYFRSPIIHGMEPENIEATPIAKRLVLIVADGLRADYLYDFINETTRAPFLRDIIEMKGTWGVSHTRVPSESRPGHVAIIGGIYEDPSAIAKGWKENPVHFDSVFNRSRHTWSWGSPDILPMFAAGSQEGHIETFMYPSHQEDFASKDASKLDTWVFDRVEKFFNEAKKNPSLSKKLNQDSNVFFLHLLGLDTNGHAHKPMSKEYKNNINLVDSGVKNVSKIFESYFKDEATAFIFTADHGMTNWGSHGAGDASETETPLIAWGAGVSGPEDPSNFQDRMLYDPRTEKWGLNHVRRHDVFQADLAPLMSAIIGVPIPVNSVGTLPVEYLFPDFAYRSQALFANAKQMLSQYRQRRTVKVENTPSLFYKPFPDLPPDRELYILKRIRHHMKTKDYEQAIQESYRMIVLSLSGIDYFIHYDRPLLSLVITLGFVGWILLLVSNILKDHTTVCHIAGNTVEGRRVKKKSLVVAFIIIFWGVASLFFLIAHKTPWQYYLYFFAPVVLWWLVYQNLAYLRYAWLITKSFSMVWEMAIRLLVITIGIEILVFSFFLRPLLSIGLVFVGLWPFVMFTLQGATEKSLRLSWLGSCILLASFTYLPVIGQEASYETVQISGGVAFLLMVLGLYWFGGENWMSKYIPIVLYIQGGMIFASVYLVRTTTFSLQMKEGLPPGNQMAAWILLVLAFILPLFASNLMVGRLMSVMASLLCPFLLLSIRHEVLFYIALGVSMFFWLILEYYLTGTRVQLSALKFAKYKSKSESNVERPLAWSDIRRAFFFLFFTILAFFGIGNIASVNSFDPSFVYCFITVFSPFIMGGLLLLKIIIPFLLVTCFFRAICSILEVPARALFLVFLVLSDVMALQFFFLIRTEGSWLDIGTSLSHFVICMATTLFIMVLSQIADFLTTFSLSPMFSCLFRGRRKKQSSSSLGGDDVLPRVKRGPHRD